MEENIESVLMTEEQRIKEQEIPEQEMQEQEIQEQDIQEQEIKEQEVQEQGIQEQKIQEQETQELLKQDQTTEMLRMMKKAEPNLVYNPDDVFIIILKVNIHFVDTYLYIDCSFIDVEKEG